MQVVGFSVRDEGVQSQRAHGEVQQPALRLRDFLLGIGLWDVPFAWMGFRGFSGLQVFWGPSKKLLFSSACKQSQAMTFAPNNLCNRKR